ncbi:MAG: EscU/YscU/HrcU family type III secretion system export apparatus switch protein [Ignavibacteriales bacterium]
MSGYNSKYRKGAIALGYKMDSDAAPKVIAKGSGELAQKIIDVARENKIFISEDPLLFDSLYKLDVGDEVPAKLYQVIAELLAFVYRVNNQRKRGYV